jgi:hypothetical protein
MIAKLHLSGEAIVYEEKSKERPRRWIQSEPPPGRIQGSLYSQQKRAICDASELIRLRNKGNPSRCALILTLTSPGYTSQADEPRFISRFFENMKKNYGLKDYLWVREYTKAGYPHFHIVADWYRAKYFFDSDPGSSRNRITLLSLYWSNLFGSTSHNSVWLGGYWQNRRIYELRTQAQCRYLTKYMGKEVKPDYVNPATFQGGPVPFRLRPNEIQGALPYLKDSVRLPPLSAIPEP